MVKVSYYNPALGGTNCSNFVEGVCISNMASGYPWQDYMEYAIACPSELPFGTKIIVENQREWICMDRGGAIVVEDGVYWIDQLTANPEYIFGSVVQAKMILP